MSHLVVHSLHPRPPRKNVIKALCPTCPRVIHMRVDSLKSPLRTPMARLELVHPVGNQRPSRSYISRL